MNSVSLLPDDLRSNPKYLAALGAMLALESAWQQTLMPGAHESGAYGRAMQLRDELLTILQPLFRNETKP